MWPYPSEIFTLLSEWLGRLSLFTVCGAAAGFVCWWHHHYSLPAVQLKQRLVQIHKMKLYNILEITHGNCILRCTIAWSTCMPTQYILHQGAEPEAAYQLRIKEGRPIRIFPGERAEGRWPTVWGWIKLDVTGLSLNASHPQSDPFTLFVFVKNSQQTCSFLWLESGSDPPPSVCSLVQNVRHCGNKLFGFSLHRRQSLQTFLL